MSNLKKINQELASAKSVKEALSIGFVKETFVRNYQAITGKADGDNRFNSEVFHYLELINDNEKLKNADKFSHFASIVKAGTTGLSFGKEGQLYPILYGNIVKVQIGAHGKRELLMRMPNIKSVGEGQVVLKGDKFKHDKLNSIILEHETSEKAPPATLDNIIATYCRLTFTDNSKIDVVVYHEDIIRAKNKSKDTRDNNTWASFPSQMCAKTTYNKAYKLYYRIPDVQVTNIKGFDADEEDTAEDISYETAEVMDPVPVMDQAVKEEKKKKEVVETAKVVKGGDELDDFIRNN